MRSRRFARRGAGRHDDQFPVDVFSDRIGHSSNMNANEVIATLASRALSSPVHANDHVNMGQSSNDVIPTAIHVAALCCSMSIFCGPRAAAHGSRAQGAECADWSRRAVRI